MPKKTTPTPPINTPLAENYVHNYQGAVQEVNIPVHINYAVGTVTLIDANPANPGSYQGKQYQFKNRGLEYMAGWIDILDAMKSAVNDAADKLQTYQVEQAKRKEKLVVDALREQ